MTDPFQADVLLPVSLGLPGQALQRTAGQYSACRLHLPTGHPYQCCGYGFIEFGYRSGSRVLMTKLKKKKIQLKNFFFDQNTGSILIEKGLYNILCSVRRMSSHRKIWYRLWRTH
jgi:hypothetical protein